jgi:AraC-like DNA-binding protein/mannose-6-phosphate isomerase-like protein (cupin superfamily)
MKRDKFHWKSEYKFVEPGINAENVRIYPFDQSFPLDVSFQRIGPKVVRLNRHSFFEVLYMFSGRVTMQIRDLYFPLEKGTVVVIGPNLYHRLLRTPNVEGKVISLNFQPDTIRFGSGDGEEEQYLKPFLCQDAQFPHIISKSSLTSREALDLILKMHQELPANTVLRRLALRTYLRMLLLLLVKHYANYLKRRETAEHLQKNQQRLLPLFQFLNREFGQAIEVKDAAHLCGMSLSHFMRFFKMTVGQPFRAYLTGFRIAKAQHLLSTSEFTIAEISQMVGFCSQSYFGEVFRALSGTTPGSYRRRFKSTVKT